MEQHALLKILERLCNLSREEATVEFKSNLDIPEEIGQYLSAIANSAALEGHDCGWMVWGVENHSHAIEGTRFNPFSLTVGGNQPLIMWLQQMTSPRADFNFYQCDHPQGKVILLQVRPPHSAPIAFQNTRYIRVDSHKTKLSEHPSKEARLWAMLGKKDDWSGELIPQATIADLDPQAIDAARKRFVEYLVKNEPNEIRHEQIRIEATQWDTPTLLNKARITKQGQVTRAALLLLGRDEAAHFLSPTDAKITWILRDKNNATGPSQHFAIPFLLATDRLFARIRNETEDYMPDGTLFPTPLSWYDPWVIREALHNCIAHQDYKLGGKINVVEHPNQLTFGNLGQFIPPSVEWMLEHQSPPEHYRNQWLIDGMIRLRMIDQVGSGIRRMFETQRARLFPLPDYRFDAADGGNPGVEVTITNQVMNVAYTQALMKRTDLQLRQVLLLDKVQKHQALQPADVQELKALKLIEGRAPNYFISAKVAQWTGQKASYIHHRGLDESYYRKLVIDYLNKYGQATRKDIEALLLSKISDALNEKQKSNKLRNLLQSMRQAGAIHRTGPKINAIWVLGPAKD